MGAFICKQPNGLYCRFSTVVDCPTHWNMTEEDYIEYCAERAREEAKKTLQQRLYSFDHVLEEYYPGNMAEDTFKTFLKDVGYEGEYENANTQN